MNSNLKDLKEKYALENAEVLENKENKKYHIFYKGLASCPWGAYVKEGGEGNENNLYIEVVEWKFSHSKEDREMYEVVVAFFKKKYRDFL